MTRAEVAALLRGIREAAGMSQAALARAINGHSSTMSRIESCQMGAELSLMADWARACGRTLRLDFPVDPDTEPADARTIREALPRLDAADLARVRDLVQRFSQGGAR